MLTSEKKQIFNNENRGGNPMKKLLKKRLNQKGLTLIELLAVIVILAIIAAIAIPAIGSIITKQKEKQVLADAQTIISAAKLAHADGACEDDTCTGNELKDYLDKPDDFTGTNNTVTKSGSDWTIKWTNPKITTFTKFENITITTGMTEGKLQEALQK